MEVHPVAEKEDEIYEISPLEAMENREYENEADEARPQEKEGGKKKKGGSKWSFLTGNHKPDSSGGTKRKSTTNEVI